MMLLKRTTILIALCFVTPALAQTADLVVVNAKVFTAREGVPPTQAFAVKDGKFIAVGATAAVRARIGPDTKIIDAGGHLVVPGLADGHFHNEGGGRGVDLSATRSLADLLAAIGKAVAAAKPGDLVVSNSDWHEAQLREQRLPLATELDTVSPANPVVLVRGGHDYILNSAALRHWNISKDTAVPEGGAITRGADGALTGELVDNAKRLVSLPPPAAVSVEDVLTTQRKVNAYGITSVRIPGSYKGEFFQALDAILAARRAGELTLRYTIYLPGFGTRDPARIREMIAKVAAQAGRRRRMGAHGRRQAAGRWRLRGRPHVGAVRRRIRQGRHFLRPDGGSAAGLHRGRQDHQRSRLAGRDTCSRRCRDRRGARCLRGRECRASDRRQALDHRARLRVAPRPAAAHEEARPDPLGAGSPLPRGAGAEELSRRGASGADHAGQDLSRCRLFDGGRHQLAGRAVQPVLRDFITSSPATRSPTASMGRRKPSPRARRCCA